MESNERGYADAPVISSVQRTSRFLEDHGLNQGKLKHATNYSVSVYGNPVLKFSNIC